MALASTQLSERGGSIPVAYHVTNLEQSHERYKMLRPSIANDETYDGDLVGLPVVPFTTTLFNYKGSVMLPTISTYPREGIENQQYQRVKIPLSRFEHCDWWKMNTYPRQIHLLFTRADGRWSKMLSTLNNTDIIKVDQANFPHLKLKNGQWEVNCLPGPVVNIFVLKAFPLDGCEWDTVRRQTPKSGHGKLVEFSTNLSYCKSKWIFKKVVGVQFADKEDKAIKQLEELEEALEFWMNEKSLPEEFEHFEGAVVREKLESASDELLQSLYYILCEDEE